jgi:plastocyanin
MHVSRAADRLAVGRQEIEPNQHRAGGGTSPVVLATVVAFVVCFLGVFNGHAIALEGSVVDQKGKPVSNAVVYLIRVGPAGARARPPAGGSRTATMIQQDRMFEPYVLPVQVGTAVSFPNRDTIKHQVYSGLGAKKFELPLYSGIPAPVTFEKPGRVDLGCSIHDWMLAHIYVVDTPHFTLTADDGRWTLPQVPDGEYQLVVWQPRMKAEVERRIVLTSEPAKPESVSVTLGPDRRPRRPLISPYENPPSN